MFASNTAPLNIGLDWDGTVTRAPDIFLAFAKMMQARGHKVYIVTMRYRSECADILSHSEWMNTIEKLVTTDRQAKALVMSKMGVKIDIWIDDNPQAVFMRAREIWGSESPEGHLWIDNGTGFNMVDTTTGKVTYQSKEDLIKVVPAKHIDEQPTLNTQGLQPGEPYVPMDVPV